MIQLSIVKYYFRFFVLFGGFDFLFIFILQCAFITVSPFNLETIIVDIGRIL